jgi:hypothetical protein
MSWADVVRNGIDKQTARIVSVPPPVIHPKPIQRQKGIDSRNPTRKTERRVSSLHPNPNDEKVTCEEVVKFLPISGLATIVWLYATDYHLINGYDGSQHNIDEKVYLRLLVYQIVTRLKIEGINKVKTRKNWNVDFATYRNSVIFGDWFYSLAIVTNVSGFKLYESKDTPATATKIVHSKGYLHPYFSKFNIHHLIRNMLVWPCQNSNLQIFYDDVKITGFVKGDDEFVCIFYLQ